MFLLAPLIWPISQFFFINFLILLTLNFTGHDAVISVTLVDVVDGETKLIILENFCIIW